MSWGRTITTSLESIIEKNIQAWRDGVNVNQWEKGKPSNIISREFFMDDDVMALGERMIASNLVTAHEWAAYMMNSRKEEALSNISFYFMSPFYSTLANDRLHDKIREFMNKSVKFKVDKSIKERTFVA